MLLHASVDSFFTKVTYALGELMAKKDLNKTYYGLTNKPDIRKQQHGNPKDWKIEHKFQNETEARSWEQKKTARSDNSGDTGGKGWKYGYSYTVTEQTME